MKIIVGLGNPGKEYEKTRHNVGFMALDFLREKLELPEFKSSKKFDAEICEGTLSGEKILLAKPNTFMNLSGDSVTKLMQFYHAEPKDLCVVYDDIDLPFGTTRYRTEGSAGTHNGMRDIIQKLGYQNFPRLRIGIESRGVTAPEEQDLSSFVLNSFNDDESKGLDLILKNSVNDLLKNLN